MDHAIHPVYVHFLLPSKQINACEISNNQYMVFTFSNKMVYLFNDSVSSQILKLY